MQKKIIMNIRIRRDLRTLRSIIELPLDFFKSGQKNDNYIRKRNRIRKLKYKLGINCFVETGTFYGQTVNFAKDLFEEVYSIEIYSPLYEYNLESFKHVSNVNLLLGDSGTVFEKLLPKLENKCIFWLDGHYSGSGTGKGEIVSPIIKEIRAIHKFHRSDNCILIDDFRLFGLESGYPSLEEVKFEILNINKNYIIEIDSDCIVAYVK
ncbi:MAG: hypothetical protein CFE22_04805 [Cytophagaceae bacterium BCCC1]|nr:MAG: hypothetical protein CFE22_04805 [Cytophagaceae bacterium BCCC1]